MCASCGASTPTQAVWWCVTRSRSASGTPHTVRIHRFLPAPVTRTTRSGIRCGTGTAAHARRHEHRHLAPRASSVGGARGPSVGVAPDARAAWGRSSLYPQRSQPGPQMEGTHRAHSLQRSRAESVRLVASTPRKCTGIKPHRPGMNAGAVCSVCPILCGCLDGARKGGSTGGVYSWGQDGESFTAGMRMPIAANSSARNGRGRS